MRAGRWCSEENHSLYETDPSFNAWFDAGDEEASLRVKQLGLGSMAAPSKALFAGDPVAYATEAKRFRSIRLARSLGEGRLESFWYRKNQSHFAQLLGPLRSGAVIPFLGAGVSCASSLPTWETHLCNQGMAAGLDPKVVRERCLAGDHERVVDEIIASRGPGVFQQSMRDDFGNAVELSALSRLTAMLTSGLIVTTNFDDLIEQAIAANKEPRPQVLLGTDADSYRLIATLSNRLRGVLKLHGDLFNPASYILSAAQYDEAYGPDFLDMRRPLPRKLRRIFEQSTILFIGYGLARDRTLRVFEQVIEEVGLGEVGQHFAIVQAPEGEQEIVDRNTALAALNINAIWYPAGEHHYVQSIVLELLSSLGRNGELAPPA